MLVAAASLLFRAKAFLFCMHKGYTTCHQQRSGAGWLSGCNNAWAAWTHLTQQWLGQSHVTHAYRAHQLKATYMACMCSLQRSVHSDIRACFRVCFGTMRNREGILFGFGRPNDVECCQRSLTGHERGDGTGAVPADVGARHLRDGWLDTHEMLPIEKQPNVTVLDE